MNTAELLSFIGVSVAILVWLGKLTWTLSSLTVKTETMWSYQMRRAFSEAVEKGVATINSPLAFTAAAINCLKPIAPQLRAFYTDKCKGLSDGETLLEIERKFGEELFDTICVPHKLSHGACLLLAYSVAIGSPPTVLIKL